jgi:hypothetical protein
MANKDAAFGFKPTRHLSGGLIRAEEYAIANNASASIFTGQVVEAVAGGGIEAAAAGDTQQLGVFGGCFFTDPTTSKPTFKASYTQVAAADIVATVYADPNIVFEVQHDGTGTSAMNHSGFDFVGVGGSSITGQSTSELDTSTSGTSGGFKQIGISKDPDNSDEATANANAYVVFNTGEHVFKLTTGV